jgi:uncharacterized protein (TIGR02186 family)
MSSRTALLRPLLPPLAVLLLGILAGPAVPRHGQAASLVADLSSHLVAITTGFIGTEVLLFGATEGEGDVAVVVKGPSRSITVRRKSRVAGIWMNTARMTIDNVPSFYAVAASRPLEEIASERVRQRQDFGVEYATPYPAPQKASGRLAAEWRDALIRNMERRGLFPTLVGPVTFIGDKLFRADIFFPANTPTGSYEVLVYLLRNGQVVSAQTTPLIVSKIGIEAELFDFAHERAAFYGIIAIIVALFAGWLAHIAFRKP